jgi:pyruvate/2-oxoglutarate/acetoin dehydrogenase E1 component
MAENGLTDCKSITRIGAAESPIPSSILLEKKMLPGTDDIINAIKSEGLI